MAPYGVEAYSDPRERVQAFLDGASSRPSTDGWDTSCMKEIKLVSVDEGIVEFEFTVTQQMCNPLNILHGGCASTILDVLTSTAVFTVPDKAELVQTLSRTLTMTFLRPVLVDTTVRVVAKLVQVGRSFIHCTGEILTLDGKVCVSCTHDKGVWNRSKM
ncbi:hypothetical protein FQN50_005198 [Emmonsiellopsis sp. PD_5]|nr:hypothetical protein FQN50_005198 [Emmonsiellopsis sp. PD_5]